MSGLIRMAPHWCLPRNSLENPSGALDTHVLSSCGRVGGEAALVIRLQIT